MSRVHRSIKNVFWGYAERTLGILLPFAFRTVMIYYMGAEYLGISSLFTSVLQVFSLSELGVGAAICYSMYRPVAEGNKTELCALLNLYHKMYSIIGCIVLVLGLCFIPFLPLFIKGDCPQEMNLYYLYLMYLFNTFFSYYPFAYCSSLFSAHQRNDVISIVSLVILLIRFSLQILVIIVCRNYYICIVALIITTILQNIIYYILSKKMYPEYNCVGKVDKKEISIIKNNVKALMMHKIGGTVLNSADTIVVSAFLGLIMVAKYSNYYYVLNAVTSIVIICFTSITSVIGNSIIVDSKEKVTSNFFHLLFANAFIVCVCSAIMACIYQDFILLWVGEYYLYSAGIMYLFVMYFYIHTIRRTIIMFRDAAGMWRDNMFQPIVSALVNLLLNIFLVRYIGVYGIIISSIFSMIVIDIPWESFAFCKKMLDTSLTRYVINLLKYSVFTLLISAICVLSCKHISLIGIKGIAVKAVFSFMGAALLFFVFSYSDESCKYYRSLMKSLFYNRKH